MNPRVCFIGLDEPETGELQARINVPSLIHANLPKLLVRDGELFVEATSGFGFVPVSKVVFHGIFEQDHDAIAGLALWGGPCLPNSRAMMDCRLKLPCLVRALGYSQFAAPARGFVSARTEYATDCERVAKWGNWHCGENKARFSNSWQGEEAAIVERFLTGDAVRVVVLGERFWQVKLEGDGWLKSIHHPNARLMTPDAELVADTQQTALGFGLEIAANDYVITEDGRPHLLEVNHIPNVTRFAEIRAAYLDYVTDWIG